MARTEIRSSQIKNINLLVEDFKDFGVVAAAGLNVTINAGRIRDDNNITDQNDQNLLLLDDTTSFVEINAFGVASSNTTGFSGNKIPLAEVVTASGSVSSITDKRVWINTGTSDAPIASVPGFARIFLTMGG